MNIRIYQQTYTYIRIQIYVRTYVLGSYTIPQYGHGDSLGNRKLIRIAFDLADQLPLERRKERNNKNIFYRRKNRKKKIRKIDREKKRKCYDNVK